MIHFTEVLGSPGVFQLVDSLYETQGRIDRSVFDQISKSSGIGQPTVDKLLGSGLFHVTSARVDITTFGQRVALLMRVLNDQEDLADAIRKLGELYPQLKPFELITNNITEYVLD